MKLEKKYEIEEHFLIDVTKHELLTIYETFREYVNDKKREISVSEDSIMRMISRLLKLDYK